MRALQFREKASSTGIDPLERLFVSLPLLPDGRSSSTLALGFRRGENL
jgi:hypothetical protein